MFDINDMEITLESFKMGLITRATGGNYGTEDYRSVRDYLLSVQEIKDLLPKFVKVCHNPDEFWQFIKNEFGSYSERRTYITNELNPLIDYYAEGRRNDEIIKVNSDSYELGPEIGSGGYGTVYKYWHKQLEINFAIKFLEPKFTSQDDKDEHHKRFFREAKMLFSLNHDSIVRFYDTGLIGNTPFIKMEYIEGCNIYGLMKKYGILKYEKSLVPIRQILEGLSHAHLLGIIHRDIKPSNIMFDTESKRFKIIDFGIGAYVEHELYSRLTNTGENIAGSTYTAPELLENPKLKDIRSDIYSVGALWYHLVTGLTPKGSGMGKHLLDFGLSSQQSGIILKCLESIEERYPSCDDVLSAISNNIK